MARSEKARARSFTRIRVALKSLHNELLEDQDAIMDDPGSSDHFEFFVLPEVMQLHEAVVSILDDVKRISAGVSVDE